MGDNGGMICASCRERRHEECRGGSWCDCQHLPPPATPEERRRSGRPTGANAEPPVNWRRQG
ncbi:hypothetical protein [Actinomadura sp. BRA 177]|uniref:hypothetical protein n=1 Tax=Actinomadura sp. BRA 177 TaxID=2745202 RepID=UPI0015953C54|nr:hypothetical protein [Actinomadura sp. BRA 177]NVI86759.1 hypothetical protein [Actinomadura sp. BRA 177]